MAASGEIQWPPMGSFPWPPSHDDHRDEMCPQRAATRGRACFPCQATVVVVARWRRCSGPEAAASPRRRAPVSGRPFATNPSPVGRPPVGARYHWTTTTENPGETVRPSALRTADAREGGRMGNDPRRSKPTMVNASHQLHDALRASPAPCRPGHQGAASMPLDPPPAGDAATSPGSGGKASTAARRRHGTHAPAGRRSDGAPSRSPPLRRGAPAAADIGRTAGRSSRTTTSGAPAISATRCRARKAGSDDARPSGVALPTNDPGILRASTELTTARRCASQTAATGRAGVSIPLPYGRLAR
jgi:hypothetical protein